MPVTQPAISQTSGALPASSSQAAAAQSTDNSGARAAANRAAVNKENAQLSTGPRTAEGKARVSLNALKTGLTGRTVLMPGDDAALYTAHLQRYLAEFDPSSDGENDLVQTLADTQWRLNRIPALEMNLFALGAIEFADKFDAYPEATRAGLIQAVSVPPGEWVIHFHYHAPHIELGLIGSLLGGLFLVVAFFIRRRGPKIKT